MCVGRQTALHIRRTLLHAVTYSAAVTCSSDVILRPYVRVRWALFRYLPRYSSDTGTHIVGRHFQPLHIRYSNPTGVVSCRFIFIGRCSVTFSSKPSVGGTDLSVVNLRPCAFIGLRCRSLTYARAYSSAFLRRYTHPSAFILLQTSLHTFIDNQSERILFHYEKG